MRRTVTPSVVTGIGDVSPFGHELDAPRAPSHRGSAAALYAMQRAEVHDLHGENLERGT
jgi:hypothetical protein